MSNWDPNDLRSLSEELRRVRPAKVRVVDRAGEARDVATGVGRAARHTMTAQTILSLGVDIERVEFLDPKGAIIATWRPSSPAETVDQELPELEAAPTSAPMTLDQEKLFLAKLVTSAVQTAVDHAMDRHIKALVPVLDGYKGIVSHLSDRNHFLEKQSSATLKLAYEAVKMQGTAEVAYLEAQNGGKKDPADELMGEVFKRAFPAAPTGGNGQG